LIAGRWNVLPEALVLLVVSVGVGLVAFVSESHFPYTKKTTGQAQYFQVISSDFE
jgi:hypothetical protein